MNSTEKKKEEILVWNSKENEDKFWNPELGELDEPEGWDFLPSGDIFLTRTVKKIGPYWVLLRRMKKYTITVGLLCPTASIEKAKKICLVWLALENTHLPQYESIGSDHRFLNIWFPCASL